MKYFLSLAIGFSSFLAASSAVARPPIEKLCPTYHGAVGTCSYKEFTVSSRSACYARVELTDKLKANHIVYSEEEIICEEHGIED